MSYTAEHDPLCYPGTTVLKNKLDIRSQSDLDEYELAVFLTRADEDWPTGQLDYEHYKALHHHLFQDVYEWAGKRRTIRIGKNGNWFCYPDYIDQEMDRVFGVLSDKNHLIGLSVDEFAKAAAHVLAEINAVHPFREGNGRTQLALLSILAEHAGFPFDDDKLDRDRVIQAMVDSFSGNEAPLSDLIRDIVSP
ncbi:Fic family protein [Mesorhizobium sp. YR577]|uniref:Fic/DOC family protein n=1 Tax=Mesorhizobium sp. YR577 TaxID=1884373 RepID=UPI0008ECE621|nr:Fic family protein [Mesorhizobium sp. YR577]SFU21066.1 cell filamentation protein [Mesorhizobium sp. YR577]